MRGKRIRDRMKFTRCGHAGIMKMKRDKKRSKAAIVLTTFRKRRVSIWIRLLERGTNTYATLYVRVNTTVRDEPTTPLPFDPFDALTRWLSIASKLGNLSLSPHLFPVSSTNLCFRLCSVIFFFFSFSFEKNGKLTVINLWFSTGLSKI